MCSHISQIQFCSPPAMTVCECAAETGAEDTALRRVAKRVEAMAAIRRTPAYIIVSRRWAALPRPPDPHDRTVSKRTWEKSVMNYRQTLRKLLWEIHNGGLSVNDHESYSA